MESMESGDNREQVTPVFFTWTVTCDAGRRSRLIFNANSGRVREAFVYRNGAWVNRAGIWKAASRELGHGDIR